MHVNLLTLTVKHSLIPTFYGSLALDDIQLGDLDQKFQFGPSFRYLRVQKSGSGT